MMVVFQNIIWDLLEMIFPVKIACILYANSVINKKTKTIVNYLKTNYYFSHFSKITVNKKNYFNNKNYFRLV